mmetsp:Transcript_26305/g.30477  ORF Transcript_26305/g.30477 Transcript_26305/m.30477 type:complete len:145 (+) Transcript_26305:28-462(+)
MSDYGSGDEKDDFRDADENLEDEDANDAPEQSDQSEEDKVEGDSDQEIDEDAQILPDTGKKLIPMEDRITPRFLTKYERARIIGTRALQISKNAPIMVEIDQNETDPISIAEKELREKVLPFIIRRYLPDGSYEDWKIQELMIE